MAVGAGPRGYVVKWYARLLLIVMASATIVAACRQYLPSNRYLQKHDASYSAFSTRDARGKFNHARHAARLQAAHVVCLDCHRFDVLIDAPKEEMARELSMHALFGRGEACHYCHGPSDTRLAEAPVACTTCHDNLLALKPADHEVAWMKVHASVARSNLTQCESCHRQSYCIDCHERRDTIQTRVHDRNFRFFHSVEVHANPMQCGSCHREDFCINCHLQGKVGLPP